MQRSRRRRPRAEAIIASVVIGGIAVVAWAAWWFLIRQPSLPRATCGNIFYLYGPPPTSEQRALTCFDTAAKACKPASIGVRFMGVDTWTNYVYTIESGTTPCQVAELSQYVIDAQGPGYEKSQGITPGACHVTRVTSAGVMLSCTDGHVLIPAPQGPITPPRNSPTTPAPVPDPPAIG
jgi:hypothetical protein